MFTKPGALATLSIPDHRQVARGTKYNVALRSQPGWHAAQCYTRYITNGFLSFTVQNPSSINSGST